jgi:hypothetical protein
MKIYIKTPTFETLIEKELKILPSIGDIVIFDNIEYKVEERIFDIDNDEIIIDVKLL